jgi:predicted RNA-binding Zn-ribbon protein involved in translation (DUF1610 family)
MNPSTDDLECAGCGYSLRGLHSHACPECGLAFDREAMLRQRAMELRPGVTPEIARVACGIASTIAIVSVMATPSIGLEQIERRMYRFGGCGTGMRNNDDLMMLLGASTLLAAWFSLGITLAAARYVRPTRTAALATTAAWLTMWCLLG